MLRMAIHFDCPWCTQTISADDSQARERVECPYCNLPVKVPTKSTRDPPPLGAPSPLPYMGDRGGGDNFSIRQRLMAIFRLALLLLVLVTMAGWMPQSLGVIIWAVLFIGSAAVLLCTR